MSSDKDKTVIGGALPIQPNPLPGAPPPRGAGGADTAAGGERTVIGGALPIQPGGQPGGQPPGGFGRDIDHGASDAWGVPGGGPAPASPAHHPPVAGAFAPSESFFPDHRSAPQPEYAPPARKIDLHAALRATGLGAGGSKNPILAAAANLLILFGRLRTQMVEMDAVPLMEHVTREIETFEANLLAAGIPAQEAQVAKYLLCGTADDIVQNIPGTDRHLWVQYSMVARFFNRRTSGVGFFQEVEKALAAPAQRFHVLELALVCLSLGFEGQYRTMNGGAVELQRIRSMIHDSLRRVEPRPDEDISPNWQPVDMGRRRRFGGTPVWVVGAVLGVMLLGAYLGLSMLISGEGSAVSSRLMALHPTSPVALQRTATFTPVIPEPPRTEATVTQLQRIREGLEAEIESGTLEVDRAGDFIAIRINNAALFDSGAYQVKAEFQEIGARIAAVLDGERGRVLVQGFTDSVPLSGRGRFKNNFELSVARAESVKGVLAGTLTDTARLEVEGRGEADPIADNATPEGRALNRRVEILVSREDTLDPALPEMTEEEALRALDALEPLAPQED